MFSFGPVKTSTALGGALLRFKDDALLTRVRSLQAEYQVLSNRFYRKRLSQYVALKLLSYPLTFGAFRTVCQFLGKSHDQVVSGGLRAFPGPDFFVKIRKQPCAPLLAVLARRLSRADDEPIRRRIAAAESAIRTLPPLRRPGEYAALHTHWIFPVLAPSPDELKVRLWKQGFDATRGASNLEPVEPPKSRPDTAPLQARHAIGQILYLPVYPQVAARDVRRLARALANYEASK
jgi:dTDP-4-amino-4,6-dideoxygalactose transaminase